MTKWTVVLIVLKLLQCALFYENTSLLHLDEELFTMLSDPITGEGQTFLNKSQLYLNRLEEIDNQCNISEPNKCVQSWLETIQVRRPPQCNLTDFLKCVEPKFINCRLRKIDLRENWGWTDTEFIEFESCVLGIIIILRKFYNYLNNDGNS